MRMLNNPLRNIEENLNKLTRGQKIIADFILNNSSEAAFFTIHDLSNAVNVSTATVMRLVNNLGYTGYKEFQNKLQHSILTKSSPQNRFETNLSKMSEENQLIQKGILFHMEALEDMIGKISVEQFDQAAHKILQANKVFCLGVKSGQPVSTYLHYGINRMLGSSHLMNPDDIVHEVNDMSGHDVLIVTSFPRYIKQVIEVAAYLKEKKNIYVIAITDNYYAPIANYADSILVCNVESLAFHNSSVAAMVIADLLLTSVAINNQDETKKRITEIDEFYKTIDYHIN